MKRAPCIRSRVSLLWVLLPLSVVWVACWALDFVPVGWWFAPLAVTLLVAFIASFIFAISRIEPL